ncbi:hypothetical protein IJ541_06080 [bacterium]|nr:hypothetical protein [bacterium]
MIGKIGSNPAFTSNVKVLYNRDFGLKSFYASPVMKEQIHTLNLNGKNDTVALIPEPGRYEKAPRIAVQVMQKSKDGENILYTTQYAYEPDEILKAYKEAKESLKLEENVQVVRKDLQSDILLYII